MDDGTKKGLLIGCGVLGIVGTCCIGVSVYSFYAFKQKAEEAQVALDEQIRAEEQARQEAEERMRLAEAQDRVVAEEQASMLTPPAPVVISPRRTSDRRTRHITARITRALGGSGLSVGDTCEYDVTVERTQNAAGYWCRAKVECGGRRLFGVDQPRRNGYFVCEIFDNPLGVAGEDLTPTRGQEDAAFQIDTRQSRMIVFDDATGLLNAEYRIEAEVVSVN